MNLLDQFLGWFRPPQNQNAGWLDWFNALSRGWSSSPGAPATSAAPSPITSTPATKPAAPALSQSQVETGAALIALLDRFVK